MSEPRAGYDNEAAEDRKARQASAVIKAQLATEDAEAEAKIAASITADRRNQPLCNAGVILERVESQLRRCVRRHRTLDLAQLDWLAGQVGEAAALVRAGWEQQP